MKIKVYKVRYKEYGGQRFSEMSEVLCSTLGESDEVIEQLYREGKGRFAIVEPSEIDEEEFFAMEDF